jgi:Ser/Thr protein kinase RdoA (MazF antagonist)
MQLMEDFFREILKGYRTETAIEDIMVQMLPLFVQANRIENIVDAFEVERSTGENYLDEEDLEELCNKILEDILI